MTMVKLEGTPGSDGRAALASSLREGNARATAEITHTISVPSSVSISPAQYT